MLCAPVVAIDVQQVGGQTRVCVPQPAGWASIMSTAGNELLREILETEIAESSPKAGSLTERVPDLSPESVQQAGAFKNASSSTNSIVPVSPQAAQSCIQASPERTVHLAKPFASPKGPRQAETVYKRRCDALLPPRYLRHLFCD